MNSILKISVLLLCFQFAFAQQPLRQVASSDANGNWWSFHQNENIAASSFFQNYQASLGFDEDYSFQLLKVEDDQLGMSHTRYQQFYKGVKVEGAQFILHSTNNTLTKANGRLVNAIQGSSAASISFEEALTQAKALTGATVFYWEVPAMEAWLKDAKNNPQATFYPKKELVWISPDFSQNGDSYQLAYKLDLFFEAREDHRIFYIDAHNGDLIWEEDRCHTTTTSGQAQTKYHGLRDIITDSVNATTYVLKDDTRGGGIETYNALQTKSPSQAVNFVDTDNFWDNVNPLIDEAATDAHWGAEATYDYFLNQHGRNSYDDFGSKIISYVHWDTAWFNASWNGIAMRYGDGNGNPLITIDIVGHELSHGVTEYAAGLVYANESGALNESFSDIFGTALEFYTLADSADWAIGKLDFHLRQMDSPNSFNDPDTYFGNFWYTGTADNGGVHINSGVQNFWFYLLSEGGQGTNDLGQQYKVDSFGIEKAAEVAYRNLNYYLTPSADYYDARRGSISATEDLYGSCSYETNLIAKAWHAVGVGSDTLSNDLEMVGVTSPKNSCYIGAQEKLEIQFIYYRSGCDSTIDAGDSIQVGYAVNGAPAVVETFMVPASIHSGDTVTYTFNSKEDFVTTGSYNIDYWVDYRTDFMPENDTITNYLIKVLDPMTEGDSLTFEFQLAGYENTIHNLIAGQNGDIKQSFQAKNTGFRGLAMSGKNADLSELDLPNSENGNFVKNPEFETKVCMCVDASAMSHVTLQFDLRQTYSSVYNFFLGPNARNLVSSLRVTVDGLQVGPQYHPLTTVSDTFQTHFLNLDNYAATQFELCLEGKHFLNSAEDPTPTLGDNSYVDNIKLSDFEFIGQEEFKVSEVAAFPNPTNGIVHLIVNMRKSGSAKLSLIDARGATVLAKDLELSSGHQNFSLDLTGKPKAMYLLRLQVGNTHYSQKILLE